MKYCSQSHLTRDVLDEAAASEHFILILEKVEFFNVAKDAEYVSDLFHRLVFVDVGGVQFRLLATFQVHNSETLKFAVSISYLKTTNNSLYAVIAIPLSVSTMTVSRMAMMIVISIVMVIELSRT